MLTLFDQGKGHQCLAHGGAITVSYKARGFACWIQGPLKAHRVTFNVPHFDAKAFHTQGKCMISTHSLAVRRGKFTCVMTPAPVKRAVESGRLPHKPPFNPHGNRHTLPVTERDQHGVPTGSHGTH